MKNRNFCILHGLSTCFHFSQHPSNSVTLLLPNERRPMKCANSTHCRWKNALDSDQNQENASKIQQDTESKFLL
eukprot:Gb_20068 [translate_table: standard]